MMWRKTVLAVAITALAMLPAAGRAQVAVYGEFSASDFKGGIQTNYLYGGTTGLVFDGPKLFHKVLLQGNLQGRFLTKNGESFDGGTLGPRFVMPFEGKGFRPYVQFMVGFARFDKGIPVNNLITTDNTFQVGVGAAKHIRGRFDAIVDFDYAQYGTENGQFNPKTFSAGLLFHITKATDDDDK